ncbi:phosphoglycerate kinase [Halovivax asiaticus JCM 14624]|uniref:Phosphoglycerate kinase n=1 Tax=Halovivax asiaticus JCM 14624 TaxID=1227490 RepID=M0BTF0_9EURY|nr:phosphoglycerate kinase [Halovivax asiaticus]ELZ14230.1 phosphoglycerate kinase [Halovivax asiaticus JCM 14624]
MIATLDDLDAAGTVVGLRVDINSPVDADGRLLDDSRIRAHVGTIRSLLDHGARVALLAHQGRPGGDSFTTLEPHADRLNELLDAPVEYVDETHGASARAAIADLADGSCVVLENTRFYSEEYMEFDSADAAATHLVERLAPVLDVYVNDAFAAAHRSQPSIVGFPHDLPSYAGQVMERELAVLDDIESTTRPRTYVLGGAKVSGSIDAARDVLDRDLADTVLTAGVVGNVFLIADDHDVGKASTDFIYDQDYWDEIDRAAALLEEYGDRIEYPRDVAVERNGDRIELPVDELPPADDEPAMDVGTETLEAYEAILDESETVVLNGPAGVYENETFAEGTQSLYRAAATVATSIVGGGDTASAMNALGIDGFTHVSTGGGAALALLTGDTLPAVEALDNAPES